MNIIKYFASTRLAFFLIAILLIIVIISAIVPQKDIAFDQITAMKRMLADNYVIVEKLNLDRIYTTPYFFCLLGLLAINIVIGNIRRFRVIYKTERTLVKARHIGSMLFHLSLVLIIFGVILNYLYMFEGVFSLTEGQKAADTEADYFKLSVGPLYADDYNNFLISLDTLYPSYEVNDKFAEAAKVNLSTGPENHPISATIYNSKPANWGSIEFHYGSKSGYSPQLVLADTLGHIVFQGFIRIAHQKDENTDRHFDFIIIGQLDLRIEIEVLPGKRPDETAIFIINVANESDVLYTEKVKLNQAVSFGEFNLVITELRRWCYIVVVKSPFLSLVFWGFWLALSGLLLSFAGRLIYRREKII